LARFIHTADWHLGVKRHYLSVEAQSRYSGDSFKAVEEVGELAIKEGASFILVCGDVFESNQVEARTVLRGLEAMRRVPVPILILPGNHDLLDASSVYLSKTFKDNVPSNVTVLENSGVVEVPNVPGIRLVCAPLRSKRPLSDGLGEACSSADPEPDRVTIAVGHGKVSTLDFGREDPAMIDVPRLEGFIGDGRVGYVALGDRHTATPVGDTGRIWYSGSLLPTDFGMDGCGNVLVVDLGQQCSVKTVPISDWRFIHKEFVFLDDSGINELREYLSNADRKDQAAVRLVLKGALTIDGRAELDDVLSKYREVFASIELHERECDLVTSMGSLSSADLGLQGFVGKAMDSLIETSGSGGEDAGVATDASALLIRLARGRDGG